MGEEEFISHPTNEELLVEYKAAQNSAQHHDTLIWLINSVVWGASLLLLGFLLKQKPEPSMMFLVSLVSLLGILMIIKVWTYTFQLIGLKRQKYDRCKEIEDIFELQQHRQVEWKSGRQRFLYSAVMSLFIIIWLVVAWTYLKPWLGGNIIMKEIFEKISNDPMVSIASLALLVSIISIFMGTISLWIQRTHNRKSVKPIGNILFSDYENHLAVNIKNAGVGPLIIKSLKVKNKNKEIKNNIVDFMPPHPTDLPWTDYCSNPASFVIPPSEKINLIELRTDDISDTFTSFRDNVRKALTGLSIELTYKDIYDKIMPANKRKLDWFGRHLISK